jgi:uncharacterized protein (DUF58 family)
VIRPGPRLPRLALLLALGGAAVPVLPELWVALALAALTLLVAFALEAAALRRVTLTAEPLGTVALPLGELERVALRLATTSPRRLRVTVRQAWPGLVEADSEPREGDLAAGETLALELSVRGVARGRADVSAPHAAISRLGLAERVLACGPPFEVLVVPDLRAVARMHAKLNHIALRGIGTRMSARLGKGRDFDRLREYVQGDELRDVAWKSSARHGKLIVREYRLDRSQDVLCCLDSGHRMAARVGGLSRLDHAVNAAVLLGYVCHRMEDRFGLLAFDTEVTPGLPPGRGGHHLRLVTEFAAGLQAERVHTDYLALAAALRRGARHRSLIVVLTALAELDQRALVEATRMLTPKHLPLVVVLADPALAAAAAALPRDKAELSRVLVAKDLAAQREQTVRELRRLGALVVECAPHDAGLSAMNAYIDVKRRQLL